MYHVITKNEYFTALDNAAIEQALSASASLGLKHTQDACILHHILPLPLGRVAEIGGGHSRTLPFLAKNGWECWNIDALEGKGSGPTFPPSHPNIKLVPTYMGRFNPEVPDDAFDVTYSVSVVEHIETSELDAFWGDIFRITKQGGLSFHAVDAYLEDVPSVATQQRISAVLSTALSAGFFLLHNESIQETVFHCHYATNTDLTIRQWNSIVPSLKKYRSRCQSVSYIIGLIKKTTKNCSLREVL